MPLCEFVRGSSLIPPPPPPAFYDPFPLSNSYYSHLRKLYFPFTKCCPLPYTHIHELSFLLGGFPPNGGPISSLRFPMGSDDLTLPEGPRLSYLHFSKTSPPNLWWLPPLRALPSHVILSPEKMFSPLSGRPIYSCDLTPLFPPSALIFSLAFFEEFLESSWPHTSIFFLIVPISIGLVLPVPFSRGPRVSFGASPLFYVLIVYFRLFDLAAFLIRSFWFYIGF